VGPYTAKFYLHSGGASVYVPERPPPNKRMQPTHQPRHQICMRKFVACLAGG